MMVSKEWPKTTSPVLAKVSSADPRQPTPGGRHETMLGVADAGHRTPHIPRSLAFLKLLKKNGSQNVVEAFWLNHPEREVRGSTSPHACSPPVVYLSILIASVSFFFMLIYQQKTKSLPLSSFITISIGCVAAV
jgi:hypothetical protein